MVTMEDEPKIVSVVEEAIEKHGAMCEALVPIMAEINQAFGYIPFEALSEVRRRVQEPEEGMFLADSHLFSVASFYKMFSLHPLGEHVIRFCVSAPCHVQGGRAVINTLQEELGIKVGETTADKKWSLIETSCLGICGVGPVFVIDGDVYGNVTPEGVHEILVRYQ